MVTFTMLDAAARPLIWSCDACEADFSLYGDQDPQACPGCGRTNVDKKEVPDAE